MELNTTTGIYLFIIGFYLVILIILLIQSYNHETSPDFLILVLIFGILGGVFSLLNYSDLPPFGDYSNIYLVIELMCWGLQFIFFYLFLEFISELRPKTWRFLIAFGFFTVQTVSLWLIFIFEPISMVVSSNLWLLADMTYASLALFVLSFGMVLYYEHYKYTHNKRILGFIIGLILASIGFVIKAIVDHVGFFFGLTPLLDDLYMIGEIFPMLGLFVYLITYIFDVDYLFLLPGDHYFLLVTYKNGVAIHTIEFETKKKIEFDENFFSGLISNLSFVFENLLGSRSPIESISSDDATFMIRSGHNILVMILTENPTAVLRKALDRYIKKFEGLFEEELKKEIPEISKFKKAQDLIKPTFPFLRIKEN